MNRLRYSLPVLLLALICGVAEGAEELPKRSSFTASKIARDPFTRINAKQLAERASSVAAIDNPAGAGLADLIRVSGISRDRLAIAVINGKAFAEREKFTLQTKDGPVRLELIKVHEASVELSDRGRTFLVQLKRNTPGVLEAK